MRLIYLKNSGFLSLKITVDSGASAARRGRRAEPHTYTERRITCMYRKSKPMQLRTELKNAKGYVTAQRKGTRAQARAGLKWLQFGGKLIFGI